MTTLIFDIETNGLLDTMDRIHSLVIRDVDTGKVTSCCPDDIEIGLEMLQKADIIVGHNILTFDIPAIKLVYPDFTPRGTIRDTLIMARLFWPELRMQDKKVRDMAGHAYRLPPKLTGRYSLEAFGHRMGLHKGDYSAVMKAAGLDPWAKWNQEMQDYCELDVEVTTKLYAKCMREAEAFGQPSIQMEHDVQFIIDLQEKNGWEFDSDAAQKLYSKLVQRRTELEDELQKVFKPWYKPEGRKEAKITRHVANKDFKPIGEKVVNKGKANERREPIYPKEEHSEGAVSVKIVMTEFNAGSRFHIADRLIKVFGWEPHAYGKDGKPTVNDEVLSALPWPEIKPLSEYLMITKRLGQIADGDQGWLKKVKSDGRIYGRVNTNGAVTGRMTHSGPNIGQVPASYSPYGPECRSLFKARKGWVMVGADADGIEGCCLAGYMAEYDEGSYIATVTQGDKKLGTDMHSMNARALGLDPQGEYLVAGVMLPGRDIAKTFFYAFLYGAGNPKLGLILGRGQQAGKVARANLLKGFPALEKVIAAVSATARQKGYLKGLDGRNIYIRHAHAALNTLLQGAGAAIMKQALVFMYEDLTAAGYKHGADYAFCGNIHDEVQIECHPEIAEEVGTIMTQAIRKAGEHFNFACPMSGSYSVGLTWGDTH